MINLMTSLKNTFATLTMISMKAINLSGCIRSVMHWFDIYSLQKRITGIVEEKERKII